MSDQIYNPEAIVQRQVDAYNAHDIEAFVATYTDDAELFLHPSELIAKGSAQIRERYSRRFREARPSAVIPKRMVLGRTVIDQEEITTVSPDGQRGTIRALVIYEIPHDKIARAWLITDRKP